MGSLRAGKFPSGRAATNNRLVGYCYDAAGNYNDISNCSGGYSYDAESRITQAAAVNYTYDGDGVRVKKSSGTLYWGETFTGGPIEETDLSGNVTADYVYFKRQAPGADRCQRSCSLLSGGRSWIHRHRREWNEWIDRRIENDSDYYPFGGEIVVTSNVPNHFKFTGKERESGSNKGPIAVSGSSLSR